MMGWMRRQNLAAQYNILTILLIVATSVGITLYTLAAEVSHNTRFLLSHGRAVAAMMAQNCEYGIYTADRRTLESLLDGIDADPVIAYAAFIGGEGDVLMKRSKPQWNPAPGSPSPKGLPRPGDIASREIVGPKDGLRYIEFIVPVVSGGVGGDPDGVSPPGTKVIGYVQLGLSMDRQNSDIRESVEATALFTSVLVLAGVGATLLFSRRIATPIRSLVTFTRSVSEETLEDRVSLGGSAEIDDLSGSVNQMLDRLKTYRDQAEEARAGLEEAHRREAAVRRQAEEARDLLSMAVEQAGETIMITGTDGTIQYVNPAFERTTGYGKEDVLGRNPSILKSGQHTPDHYQAMWNTLLCGEAWTGAFVNKRKDGTLIEEVAVISPVRDAWGKVVNYIAVKRDVTREIQMEEQLRQSQKMEAVGKLAGGIAHDFNNLLMVINGYADMIIAACADREDKCVREIREIRKAGERAAALTRQLLAFSRKQMLQPRVVGLDILVSGMGGMLRRLIREDVELLAIAEPGLWPVKVDPGQIEQVVLNLVINARDAMPAGGRLTIETRNVVLDDDYVREHRIVKPGPYVMLAVSDSGHGMSREVQARIFEPFFTTKEQGKGTGLGLSTVYGIVKQSMGYIWVYSEPGNGTTFKVYLPRVDEPVLPAEVETPRHSTQAREEGEIVLVAEDEDAVRNMIRRILEENGYKVLEARDGKEALELVDRRDGPIHLLLTDVVMPRMNGRELARRVSLLHPRVGIVYMSGYTKDAIVQHGALDPGTRFLTKPFAPPELVRKVRAALDAAVTDGDARGPV